MPDTVTMKRECGGRLVVLTINNPPVNALSRNVRASILACLEELRADIARGASLVRVVIIQGSERCFSAGADLRGELLPSLQEADVHAALDDFLTEGHQFVDTVAALPVYTIACMSGYAYGGGLELALACDERLATPDTHLGFPEVKLDMLPGWGGIVRCESLAGIESAMNLYETGVSISAREAQGLGMVSRCFESLEEQRIFVTRLVRADTSPVSEWHFWRKRARPLSRVERLEDICLFSNTASRHDPEWKILEFLHRKEKPCQDPNTGFLITESGKVLLARHRKNISATREI